MHNLDDAWIIEKLEVNIIKIQRELIEQSLDEDIVTFQQLKGL